MNKKIIVTLFASSLLAAAARAEVLAPAKKLFAEKSDAVVWVTGVAKISFSAADSKDGGVNLPDDESKVEALATLVDTNGLAVTILSQLDPARALSGRSLRTAQGPVKVEAVSTLKEVAIVMPDGTEIPAELILKDTDLDLAVLRIKTASKEAKGLVINAIDLKDSATGHVLDETVTLTRMDEVFNRVPNVFVGQVNMVTKKPRVFLRATGATGGCPTFNADGKILGITTGRYVKGKTPAAAIIPAADVLEVLGQIKPAAADSTGSK